MTFTRKTTDGPKVLIVNDDRKELDVFVAGLNMEGIDVQGSTCPSEALTLVDANDINVVLVDLMIPEMNGLQLARKIRSRRPRITTILMSDYLLSPVQLAKADTGVVGFVPKPCRFEELARFIREKIESYYSGEEATSANCEKEIKANVPFDVFSVQFSL